jgi:hypothetical protein
MPRDGSGIYSKPAGTTAAPNTTIQSSKYNQTIDDLVADANAARPIVAGGTGGQSVGAARQNMTTFTTKTTGYTAALADAGAIHRCTAAMTVNLTAAATLGQNWSLLIAADGGSVTVDPNASETINGISTLVIPDGSSAEIICDGSNFFTVIRPSPWVAIGGPITLSGQSSVAWTDLGSFRHLRLTLEYTPSSAARVFGRVSVDNGSTWKSAGTDYAYGTLIQTAATVSGIANSLDNAMSFESANSDTDTCNITVDITNFNKNLRMLFKADTTYFSSSVLRRELNHGYGIAYAGRNALQVFPGAANFASGQVTLEGIRG